MNGNGNHPGHHSMPGAAFEGGYADLRLDADGDVLNPRANFVLGDLLVDNQIVDPNAMGGVDLSDFARLSLPNVFQQVNTFNGLRLVPKTVIEDYPLQTTDIEVLVDCSVNDIDISLQLPPSTGSGQTYHIKKPQYDTTDHIVSVNVQGFDLIDGAISVNLGEPGADTLLTDSAPGYWSIFGPDFSDMLILPLLLDKSRLMEDGEFLLYNPDMATYHAIRIRGADDDSLYMEIDAGIS